MTAHSFKKIDEMLLLICQITKMRLADHSYATAGWYRIQIQDSFHVHDAVDGNFCIASVK